MNVAVLGGGLTGCCVAMALAGRGRKVTIYDRATHLFTGASESNEGKVHLGYVYAGDPTLATARRMISGALSFEPLLRRYLEARPNAALSTPFVYGVEQTSQMAPESFEQHLRAVHALLSEAMAGEGGSYFGEDVTRPPRRRDAAALAADFDPERIVAAFDTPEIAVEPEALAAQVRGRIAADANISVRTGHTIDRVEETPRGIDVTGRHAGGAFTERHSHVVNALWDGRLAIDAGLGLLPARPWFHRLKFGVRFTPPPGVRLPSATFVLGPYGDAVRYNDGSVYLSWYPAGMVASSMELVPPFWPREIGAEEGERIAAASLAGLAGIIPAIGALDVASLSDLRVKGGIIVAWGKTDIDDRRSELHERHAIGVVSRGRYHSIDTGKLTTAPYFAALCADRILAG